jgi:hypothetical protein
LKRSLPLAGKPGEAAPADPRFVRLGGLVVRVADAYDGRAAKQFADMLIREGAVALTESTERSDMTIVIRTTPTSPEGHLRAEALESGSDLVLGSAREAFARCLAQRQVG